MRPLPTSPTDKTVSTDYALVGGFLCSRLIDSTADLSALDSSGFWVVVLPYDGDPVCARFADVKTFGSDTNTPSTTSEWSPTSGQGSSAPQWVSTLSREEFISRVEIIRDQIADGNVYQVNLTRVISTPVEDTFDIWQLGETLQLANRSPHGATVSIPSLGIQLVSASPELFLKRDGQTITSSPIKGTAASVDGFLDKDWAENVMIVDLVRNDLGRVCKWGSVHVPKLCAVEQHPGLFHMVSTVEGELRDGYGWSEVIDAAFPPGSITGAPKIAAVDLIDELEPNSRGIYCGSVGWVDADRQVGELNVAIRTFWIDQGHLNFGTGGGITHDSDAEGEWIETQLKAARLIEAASSTGLWTREGNHVDQLL